MKISTIPITHRIKHLQPIFTIAKSSSYFCSGGINGEMKLWNLSYDHVKTVKKHCGSVSCVAFSLDERFLASAGDDGKLFIFDVASMDIVKTIKHPCDVTHFIWTPEFLLSANLNGELVITRIADFLELRKLKVHDESILGMAISPDFKLLCTCSESKIVLYENFNVICEKVIEKGTILENLQSKPSFSPNGSFISLGLQFNRKIPTVDILDLSLTPVFSLAGHVAPSEVTAFCPLVFKNIKKFFILAVASQDLSISLWNTLNPKPFVLLKNITESPVLDMFWDGLVLYVSSYDGVVIKIEFDEKELGEVIQEGNTDQETGLPFCDKNIELKRAYEKRAEKLDFGEELEVIKLTGFTVGDNRQLEDILNEQAAIDPSKEAIEKKEDLVPKPVRIAPIMLDQEKKKPVVSLKEGSVVFLFDTAVPEKLKLQRTAPFKQSLTDFTVELKETGELHVFRAGRFFYKITGPCGKVCFNSDYVVVYTSYVQIYELFTGVLLIPFISIRLTYLDLLEDKLLLVDAYGDFKVLKLTTGRTTTGKLPKTRGLTKIQLSKSHFLIAEYNNDELMFYYKRTDTWMMINPKFNSIVSGAVDFYNDHDETLAELELCFVHYSLIDDQCNMKKVIKQIASVIIRIQRLEDAVEYKLERFMTQIKDKKFIEMILEEFNEVLVFQRFVVEQLSKLKEQ
ncbi:HIR complex subunit [Glugoides intestinalis]